MEKPSVKIRIKKNREPRTKRITRVKKKQLVIDASPESDVSVLPVKVGYGVAEGKDAHTLDQLAEVVGRDELINMCRLADTQEAKEFVRLALVEGPEFPLEKILEHMNVAGGTIVGALAAATYTYHGHVSKIITAINSSKAALANAKSAMILGPDGFPDRKLLLQMMGLVPKEGPTVIGQLNVNGGMERPEATYQGTAQRVEDED